MVLRGVAGGGHPGERCRCIRGGWSETGRLKITGGSGGRVIARQALFCREAVALAPHADPERMGGLRAVSAGRPDPTPTNVTDGIPGVDPCRSLHGIITAPRRFAPTADRLHRNAPFVHSIAKSGIGRRDPAIVPHDGCLRSRHSPRPRSAVSGAGAGRASGLSRPCATVTPFMKRRALESSGFGIQNA